MKSQEIPSLSKLKKIKLDDLDDEIKERLYSYCETLDDRLYPESTKMIKGKYKTLYVFGKMVKRMEPKSEHRKKGELLIFMAVERTTKQKTKDEEEKTEIRETKKEKRGGAKTEFLKYKEEGETKIDRIVREEIEICRLRKKIKSLKKRFNRDEMKLINKLVSELSEKLDFNTCQELNAKKELLEFGIRCKNNGIYYGPVLVHGFGNIKELITNENDIIKYGEKLIELEIKCRVKGGMYEEPISYRLGRIRDLITNENRFNKFIELGIKCAENWINYRDVLKGFEYNKDLITNENRFNKFIELGIKCAENGINYGDVLKGFEYNKDLITNENRFNKFIELGIKCAENGIYYGDVLKYGFGSIKDLITNENDIIKYGNKFIELGIKCAENGINYRDVLKYGFRKCENLITNENDIIKYGNKLIELAIKCAENGIDLVVFGGTDPIEDLITNENRFNKFIELGIKCAENGIYYYTVSEGWWRIRRLITNENRFNKFIELGIKCADKGINWRGVLELIRINGYEKSEQFIEYLLNAGARELKSVPISLYQILIERMNEKKEVLNRITKPERRQFARSKIVKTAIKEYNEFKDQLISGKEVTHPEYFIGLLFDTDYDEDLKEIMDRLHISVKGKTQHEIYKEIYDRLVREYSAPLKIAPDTRKYEFKFLTENITLKIPEDVEEGLISVLTTSYHDYEDVKAEELEELINYTIGIEEVLKTKDIDKISKELGLNRDVITKYIEGTISHENMLRMIMKRVEIDKRILNYLIWRAVERSGRLDVFTRYMHGEDSPDIRNSVFTGIQELDIYLEDVLRDYNLTFLEPAVKGTELYDRINYVRSKITEVKSKEESKVTDITLLFTPEKTLLDLYQGVYSGTCFGGHPYDMMRREVFVVKIFIDGEIKGAVLSIVRKVKGKDSIIIIGFDVSEGFVSNLSTDKKHEFIDEVMERVKDFCKKNDLGLYITTDAGGISNRAGFSDYLIGKYFGDEKIKVKPKTTFHPVYHYVVRSAVNVK